VQVGNGGVGHAGHDTVTESGAAEPLDDEFR
jgi:hypothetical protein